jgi:hypothetical protein
VLIASNIAATMSNAFFIVLSDPSPRGLGGDAHHPSRM